MSGEAVLTLALLGAPFVAVYLLLELDAWRWRRRVERDRQRRGGYLDRRDDWRQGGEW